MALALALVSSECNNKAEIFYNNIPYPGTDTVYSYSTVSVAILIHNNFYVQTYSPHRHAIAIASLPNTRTRTQHSHRHRRIRLGLGWDFRLYGCGWAHNLKYVPIT